jgi:hypothetical protein
MGKKTKLIGPNLEAFDQGFLDKLKEPRMHVESSLNETVNEYQALGKSYK